jgi:hypothetical protein
MAFTRFAVQRADASIVSWPRLGKPGPVVEIIIVILAIYA